MGDFKEPGYRSNCTTVCAEGETSPATNGKDISCNDGDFNDTATGSAFQACVSCELRSQARDQATGQTDVGWALYNLRYALDWCIFGFPTRNDQVQSNACIETCDAIAMALETNILTPNLSSPYDYCQADPAFLTNLSSCAFCQSFVPNRVYLSNFLNTLKASCKSQPSPSTAFPISPLQIFTLQPPASYSSIIAKTSTTRGLSRSAKIAIGVIVPLVVLLLLAIFFLYWYRRYKSSTSPAHRYRPQQSSLDERWGDTKISRPTGGPSQYASANPLVPGSQSYFPSPTGAPQPHHSPDPLETQYAPVPLPTPEQHLIPSHPHMGISSKGKSREADMPVTHPAVTEAHRPSRKGFGKSVRGLTPMLGKKPKVALDTAGVARGGDDLEDSPSDLFG
ncbi:hypothetical protein LPUS_10656 [Lasallia pustulata]|uniref:Uncharacterized protein n=1 Tax=Lasallia pustulata TaxID=136370 RepID=A0A1W5D9Z8_9LECA|nr:hypothetical protein LPUS_10656 [Lasallia pustulata]